MPGYKTLEELMVSGRGAGRAAFTKSNALENAPSEQLKVGSKKGISLEEATKRHNAIMESGGYHQDSSGKSITPDPTTSGSLKSQDAAQGKVVDKFKAGSKWSQLDTAGKIAAGGQAAASILNTIDMLTGGQDTILPGSGHTYSPKQDTSMYIGQGTGY